MIANRRALPSRRETGFTLIELMIVVVIAAIIISIAIPSYTNQTRKSRRTEAKTAVLDLASREERYFSTNNQYTTDPTLVGYAPTGSGAAFPQSAGTYYQITVAVPDPAWGGGGPSYKVTATPSAGSPQLQDSSCTAFSVTQTGSQTATGTLGNACWQ